MRQLWNFVCSCGVLLSLWRVWVSSKFRPLDCVARIAFAFGSKCKRASERAHQKRWPEGAGEKEERCIAYSCTCCRPLALVRRKEEALMAAALCAKSRSLARSQWDCNGTELRAANAHQCDAMRSHLLDNSMRSTLALCAGAWAQANFACAAHTSLACSLHKVRSPSSLHCVRGAQQRRRNIFSECLCVCACWQRATNGLRQLWASVCARRARVSFRKIQSQEANERTSIEWICERIENENFANVRANFAAAMRFGSPAKSSPTNF